MLLVTPFRDGMNLVAKEFVATRLDDDGVLVLSEFTGAADELIDAVLVNPHDERQFARRDHDRRRDAPPRTPRNGWSRCARPCGRPTCRRGRERFLADFIATAG